MRAAGCTSLTLKPLTPDLLCWWVGKIVKDIPLEDRASR